MVVLFFGTDRTRLTGRLALLSMSRANSGQVAGLADKNLLQHIDLARILFDRVIPRGRKAR
jgi:hypothetical protein